MNLKPLKIGNLEAKLPIIQGGMGVGVSLSSLAGAVASYGGIGVVSAAHPGYNEDDFETNTLKANIRALKYHIKTALNRAKDGLVGVNIMCAANNYEDLVKASIDANVDIIISGAGIPRNLPELCMGSDVKMAPIVSSEKVTSLILKLWDRRYNVVPDAIVFEGPDAGGHLGFKMDDVDSARGNFDVEIKNILNAIKPYQEKYKKEIPLIVAGGIYSGYDIARVIKLGASGVQMGTRFVATHECDASEHFKMAYVNSKKEDIGLLKSPVGLPGRAIINSFAKSVASTNRKIKKCYKCIKTCNPSEIPYCITNALIDSVNGETDDALVFCGSNAYKVDKIVSVEELLNELKTEISLA